ncbi:N-acetylmannosamine-6-phosphate 2-epimerase [Streptomyces sp. AJS327]|uniref:N-acetylmannosamine-6-phosphate 2-epimerase n=1 Tax=Streptomyces sp. AJS327 TaxID=2545265 RepID=UPI0015E050EB|nr:N-acetylmannosamine-6-phosphate 2-epimerase [Streptomyces sp. AJS327]MBA0052517.1 N-acetylmannosamine-6-phosphate 2-epimerase [Streptomyces sp. AJS327]
MSPCSPQHPSGAPEFPRTSPPVAALSGGLVVSCQAPPGDPLHGPRHMTAMALAARLGGAAGIRAEGTADVRAIADTVELPLIGLWKDGADGVYITPTVAHALAVAEAGADIVAVDATGRPRPDGRPLAATVEALRERDLPVMADVSTAEEGRAAEELGVALLSTTLSGYTPHSPAGPEPDLALVERLAARAGVPVVAEGRVTTPEQARRAFDAGAYAVVVGTAITAPARITERFAEVAPAHRAGAGR